MTMDAISIEIEELTPEQAEAIWQEQRKRPANYLEFLMYMRTKSIGQAFNVKVHGSTDKEREEHVKSIKRWFGEAGKERVRFDKLESGETVETPEPVAIRWKEDSHKEKRTVTKDGKRGEVEIKVVDKLHGKVLPLGEVKARGRAAADNTEVVDTIVSSMTYAAGSKTLELPDGRKAKLTRSGHWRAPKATLSASSPVSSQPVNTPGSNGSTDATQTVGAAT